MSAQGFVEAGTAASPWTRWVKRGAATIAAGFALAAADATPAAGADAIDISLVPSFGECTSPDSVHAAPFAVDSCTPTRRNSEILTIGTPDANGHNAGSSGHANYTAVAGDPATPADEADVKIDVDVTDIRCAVTNLVCPGGAGSDYTGKVIAASTVRITDANNGPNGNEAGTAVDVVIPAPIDCVATTADTGIGGSCTLNTSADALLPDLVKEGADSTWQFNAIQLWDAGPSGQGVGPACSPGCSAEDGSVFMQQGIFIGGSDRDPSADPKIAAAGDIACSPTEGGFNGGLGTASACRQHHTSNLLLDAGLAAVLPLGDTQYDCATLPNLLGSFDLSWGRVKSLLRPVPGNHDYGCSDVAAGFFDYFGLLTGGSARGYYSFDVGSWHLIALNSNCGRVSCAAGSEQEQWLRDDLAAHPNQCTLAYWHHPLYSSGRYAPGVGSVRPLWQALYDAGADVVLAGHDHNYERYARQDATGNADARGIREFVVGTGGKSHYGIGEPTANSETHNDDTFGVLELMLRPEGYSWRFLPEAGDTYTDSGTDTCVSGG